MLFLFLTINLCCYFLIESYVMSYNMCSLHYTLYNVHCTLHIVQYTMYSVNNVYTFYVICVVLIITTIAQIITYLTKAWLLYLNIAYYTMQDTIIRYMENNYCWIAFVLMSIAMLNVYLLRSNNKPISHL